MCWKTTNEWREKCYKWKQSGKTIQKAVIWILYSCKCSSSFNVSKTTKATSIVFFIHKKKFLFVQNPMVKFCSVSINFFVHSIQRHKLHTRSPGRRISSRVVAIYAILYIYFTYVIVATAIANMESAMCWCGASLDYDDKTMGEFAYVLRSRSTLLCLMLNCWFTLLFCSKDKRHDENIKVINKNIISLSSVVALTHFKNKTNKLVLHGAIKHLLNNMFSWKYKGYTRPSKRHK